MQTQYREEMIAGRPGQLDSGFHDIVSLVNDQPRAAQVDTLVITGATNDKTYTVTIDGIDIPFTADASATVAEIADGFEEEINEQPLVNGRVLAVSDGVDTVTVTGRIAGVGWTMTEDDAEMTLAHTTPNALADAVAFGLLVMADPADDGFAQLIDGAHMTAHEIVLTPVVVNTTLYGVNINFDGLWIHSEFTSDGSATAKEIVEGLAADINTNMPANTVVATEDDATLTLTSEIPGIPFELAIDGVLLTTTSDNAGNAMTDFNKAARGATVYVYSVESIDEDTVHYPAGSVMSVIRKGRIMVPTEAAISAVDPVYCRHTADGALDVLGGFSNAPGTGLFEFTGARWHKQVEADLAVLTVDLT